MAVSVGPIRKKAEKALVGAHRLLMAAAVAEQPSAKIERFRIRRSQGKRTSATFERLIAPLAMEQPFGESAIQLDVYVVGRLAPPHIDKASLQRAGLQRVGKGSGINRGLGEVLSLIQF
jgi:hypothetical protein